MDKQERWGAIAEALAVARSNALVPAQIAAGLTALAFELRDQGERLASVERAVFGKERGDGKSSG